MKKINSYDELSNLIKEHLRKGVFTNCFITKEEFQYEIEKDRLFYHLYEGGLLIFRKMDNYFKMNFYINDPIVDLNFDDSDVIISEVVCSPNYDYLPIIELLNRCGMRQKLKRVRLFKNSDEIKKVSLNVEKVILKDYKKIIKLFEENFDKYVGCIPSEEEVKLDIMNGNFYCYKENDKIVGVLRISSKGGVSNIKHLMVDKNYRDKGIAKALLNQYLSNTSDCKKYVWTGEDNEAALKTYFSVGYKPDGYVSYVLTNKL